MINKALKILKEYYGYDSFRTGQNEIIESILNNQDVCAIMPTGAGKSICYQIPALIFNGITLVISPLISLMKDQIDALKDMGINATFINSSLDFNEVNDRINNLQKGIYKIIYVAPERLESFEFCEILRGLEIKFIAVDESHCVSQWGHDFRPSYIKIINFINSLPKRPVVAALTATATETVKGDIIKALGLRNPNIVVTGFDRPNLKYSVIKAVERDKFILDFLKNNDETGIIYTSTRNNAEQLYQKLLTKGHKVGLYHAGLSDNARNTAQEEFSRDSINVIVATNAFGMGIDKSNVRFVIHYNMPKNIEAYYQEAGRAGRDGEPSECILLFSAGDIQTQKYFIDESDLDEERKAYEYSKLRAMTDYCYTTNCLRQHILNYFNQSSNIDNCNNCSNCNSDYQEKDITTEAQKVISCVYRVKERFGVGMVADILYGSRAKSVLKFGFETLPTYGIMREYKQKDIVNMTNILISHDYLKQTDDKFPVVRITQKGYEVLKGQEKVLMRFETIKKAQVEDDELFERLRSLRKQIADSKSIPPFIVFTDASLKDMCKHLPTDSEEFLQIQGVGLKKYEEYGQSFINHINTYISEKGIDVSKKLKPNMVKEKAEVKEKTHIISYNLYKQGNDIGQIANHRSLANSTIIEHLIKCIIEGFNDINLEYLIPKQYEHLIYDTIKKHGPQKLKPIKDDLPEEVSYDAIRVAIFKYINQK